MKVLYASDTLKQILVHSKVLDASDIDIIASDASDDIIVVN